MSYLHISLRGVLQLGRLGESQASRAGRDNGAARLLVRHPHAVQAPAIIVGVLPGLQATGKRLQSDLRQLSGGTNARLGKTWTGLIVTQVAVNMGWNQIRQAATLPTFPAAEYVTARVAPEGAVVIGTSDTDSLPPNVMRYADRLTELLQRLEADAMVAAISYRGYTAGRESTIRIESRDDPEGSLVARPLNSSGIDINFFRTFGVRVLAGRTFEPADYTRHTTAVIVNQAFVRQVLGGENGVGMRIRHVSDEERSSNAATAPRPWFEIVGVVEDMYRNSAAPEEVQPELFYPVTPVQLGFALLNVRLRRAQPTLILRPDCASSPPASILRCALAPYVLSLTHMTRSKLQLAWLDSPLRSS